MTKIEHYQLIKSKNDLMIERLYLALGKGSKIDKNYIEISTSRTWSSDPEMGYLHGQYGYYGCSSVKDIMNPNTADYIRNAINKMMPQIVATAIELARKDIEHARIAAVTEAQEVLQEATK